MIFRGGVLNQHVYSSTKKHDVGRCGLSRYEVVGAKCVSGTTVYLLGISVGNKHGPLEETSQRCHSAIVCTRGQKD